MRGAILQDAEFLFNLANDPEVRRWSTDPTPITWEHHLEWIKGNLPYMAGHAILIEETLAGVPVGYVRLKQCGWGWLISIAVAELFRGQGWSLGMLTRAMREFPGVRFSAKVKIDNIASIKLFLDAGFRAEREGEYWMFKK